jgi:hypothetical protein
MAKAKKEKEKKEKPGKLMKSGKPKLDVKQRIALKKQEKAEKDRVKDEKKKAKEALKAQREELLRAKRRKERALKKAKALADALIRKQMRERRLMEQALKLRKLAIESLCNMVRRDATRLKTRCQLIVRSKNIDAAIEVSEKRVVTKHQHFKRVRSYVVNGMESMSMAPSGRLYVSTAQGGVDALDVPNRKQIEEEMAARGDNHRPVTEFALVDRIEDVTGQGARCLGVMAVGKVLVAVTSLGAYLYHLETLLPVEEQRVLPRTGGAILCAVSPASCVVATADNRLVVFAYDSTCHTYILHKEHCDWTDETPNRIWMCHGVLLLGFKEEYALFDLETGRMTSPPYLDTRKGVMTSMGVQFEINPGVAFAIPPRIKRSDDINDTGGDYDHIRVKSVDIEDGDEQASYVPFISLGGEMAKHAAAAAAACVMAEGVFLNVGAPPPPDPTRTAEHGDGPGGRAAARYDPHDTGGGLYDAERLRENGDGPLQGYVAVVGGGAPQDGGGAMVLFDGGGGGSGGGGGKGKGKGNGKGKSKGDGGQLVAAAAAAGHGRDVMRIGAPKGKGEGGGKGRAAPPPRDHLREHLAIMERINPSKQLKAFNGAHNPAASLHGGASLVVAAAAPRHRPGEQALAPPAEPEHTPWPGGGGGAYPVDHGLRHPVPVRDEQGTAKLAASMAGASAAEAILQCRRSCKMEKGMFREAALTAGGAATRAYIQFGGDDASSKNAADLAAAAAEAVISLDPSFTTASNKEPEVISEEEAAAIAGKAAQEERDRAEAAKYEGGAHDGAGRSLIEGVLEKPPQSEAERAALDKATYLAYLMKAQGKAVEAAERMKRKHLETGRVYPEKCAAAGGNACVKVMFAGKQSPRVCMFAAAMMAARAVVVVSAGDAAMAGAAAAAACLAHMDPVHIDPPEEVGPTAPKVIKGSELYYRLRKRARARLDLMMECAADAGAKAVLLTKGFADSDESAPARIAADGRLLSEIAGAAAAAAAHQLRQGAGQGAHVDLKQIVLSAGLAGGRLGQVYGASAAKAGACAADGVRDNGGAPEDMVRIAGIAAAKAVHAKNGHKLDKAGAAAAAGAAAGKVGETLAVLAGCSPSQRAGLEAAIAARAAHGTIDDQLLAAGHAAASAALGLYGTTDEFAAAEAGVAARLCSKREGQPLEEQAAAAGRAAATQMLCKENRCREALANCARAAMHAAAYALHHAHLCSPEHLFAAKKLFPEQMTRDELRTELRARTLDPTGPLKDLVRRLAEALEVEVLKGGKGGASGGGDQAAAVEARRKEEEEKRKLAEAKAEAKKLADALAELADTGDPPLNYITETVCAFSDR